MTDSRQQHLVVGSDSGQHGQDGQNVSTQHFQGKWKLFLSSIGCVVGTGNIWRFPRILANNSENEGCLVFLIVWVLCLFIWSIPMLILEYTLGRMTGKAVLASFKQLGGRWAIWCGAWVCMVTFCIACYYSVVLGWCLRYLVYFMINELPTTPEGSTKIFNDFADDSYWPILTTAVAIILSAVFIMKGVKTIEIVSMILVPLLLIIVVFIFIWSLTRPYAGVGLTFLFTPDWASFGNLRLWIDALSQNAFDTGAGAGLMVSYATFMTHYGVVRYAHIVPAANNFVSLICGMTIFASAFSAMISSRGYMTQPEIVEILKSGGTGGTGLTFIWLPVLFESFGVLGRAVTILFFICLAFAGLTSLMANMELFTRTLVDLRLPRNIAIPVVSISMFGIGLLSATNLDILTNQDFVWGFGLVLNGTMFAGLVIFSGVGRYVDNVNQYSPRPGKDIIEDWRLRPIWGWFIRFMAIPLGALLIIWWLVDLITSSDGEKHKWYELGIDTFVTTILEWISLLVILFTINAIYVFIKHRRPKDGDNGVGRENERTALLNPADQSHSPLTYKKSVP